MSTRDSQPKLVSPEGGPAPVTLAEIIKDPPSPHRGADGEYFALGFPEEVLTFIAGQVDQSSKTLETGCGLSTTVFALLGTQHIAISPAAYEFEQIKEYCHARDIATDQICFYAEPSELLLPNLACDLLDLVLIDGRHGMPAPFIDFYYTSRKLKVGGLLVIDDTWLWTGRVLKDFLLAEPEWALEIDFPPRTAVFRKLADGSENKEWADQKFVVENSEFKLGLVPLSYSAAAIGYLRRGEYLTLAKRIATVAGRSLKKSNDRS